MPRPPPPTDNNTSHNNQSPGIRTQTARSNIERHIGRVHEERVQSLFRCRIDPASVDLEDDTSPRSQKGDLT